MRIAGQLLAPKFFGADLPGQFALLGKQSGGNALPDVGAGFGERFQQAAGAAAFADPERGRGVSGVRPPLV